jgi:bacillolysin
MRKLLGLSVFALFLLALCWHGLAAQEPAPAGSRLRIATADAGELRSWDQYINGQRRAGGLRVVSAKPDPDLPFRMVERLDQFHNGVRIWGADVVRNTERGEAVSIFGSLAPETAITVQPTLNTAAAETALAGADRRELLSAPELVVLPLPSGGFALAYTAVVASQTLERVFVDAHTGAQLWHYSELLRQSAVGTGVGVVGDTKKLSVVQRDNTFVTSDSHRPPVINTYDMKGNLNRTKVVLLGGQLGSSDLASDADNVWTDPAVVDAHAYIGWTYDYFFKRFGRHGLDDRDQPITALTNPVTQQGALTLSGDDLNFAVNAFWCPVCGPNHQGVMLFGNGIPPSFTLGGQLYTYLAGALDVVAHELTHAVTSSTSNLLPSNESGALNESFSDMMGTSAEFFFKDLNAYKPPADYLIGEDAIRAGRAGTLDGIRSMSNPAQYGDPDHYRNKYVGPDDSGGLHTNVGIPNQAFYLAIEGGTNRTSGLSVTGVGATNRDQIEKAFYRAFTLMLPANATFVTARSATAQAARDLYGANSRAEQAIDQAWNAVGVPNAASITTQTGTVDGKSQTSFVVTMAASGTFQLNLRGNDSTIDLDLYLTPNTAPCQVNPVPPTCILTQSVTPEAVESLQWTVAAGRTFRVWVDNLGARSTTFTVEHFITQ